ncbi:MAG: aminotransferase class V-fold PLP-dependent enzyme [Pseudomonadota bacterium]
MPSRPLYADYAATTPVDERVAAAMGACLTLDGKFGNPASRSHALGWEAEEAVEQARGTIARLLNADPREIVFTSGATESNNLALKGVMQREPHGHLITSAIEHKATLDTAEWLEQQGYSVTYLEPDADGLIHPERITAAIRPDTRLVSLMHVNNEIGVAADLPAIGALCRERDVLFHTDAAQGFGKLPIDVQADGIDLLSVSGHKIYGPKGVGILYVRREPPLHLIAQIHGGGHEHGLRSGTLATHQIVGLGAATAIMAEAGVAEAERLSGLRERLWAGLAQIPGTVRHGHPTQRVAGILNVGFADVEGETLLMALDDVAVSNGSACTSASVEPSFVLRSLGVPDALAHASLRISVGRYTTPADVDHIVARLTEITSRLRRAA